MWRRYFKLVKLVPGKVIIQEFGTIDFAGNVPVETCKALFEADCQYLEITELGKQELYGIKENPPLIPPFTIEDEKVKKPVKNKRRKRTTKKE